jgi:uncharacterized protein YbbK (DUF523 family)
MLIVSACLAGMNTRYDGGSKPDERIIFLVREGKAIPLCPEQLGGLPTPRPRAEIHNGNGGDVLDKSASVLNERGEDISALFIRGASEMLCFAEIYQIKGAILKEGSPSCGVTYIKCNGRRVAGMGVTAALLQRKGIKVTGNDSL